MQHKVIGARTQARSRPSERAKEITARAKESSAKAKAKVKTAEKDLEKARAKTKDGAPQPHHRQVLGKAPTTECVTTAGSGAILTRTAQFRIVGKQPDLMRRCPTKRFNSRKLS